MSDRHYIAAYWTDRRQHIDDCAATIHGIFRALAGMDEHLGRFYAKGETPESSREIELAELDQIRAHLMRKHDPKDAGAPEHPQYGFYVETWNGRDGEERVFVDISIGSHINAWNAPTPNSVIITLPQQGALRDRLLLRKTAARIVTMLAETLEPDWAIVTTRAHLERKAMEGRHTRPFVGWMNWLPKSRGKVPKKLPKGVKAEKAGKGTLFSVSKLAWPTGEAKHDERLEALDLLLEEAGILRAVGEVKAPDDKKTKKKKQKK